MRDLFAGSSPRSIRTAEQAGMARTWKGIPSTVLWHFALIVCLLLRFRLQMRHDLALTTAYAKCTGRDPRIDPQIQAISLLIFPMPRSGGEIYQLHGGLVAGVTGVTGVKGVTGVSWGSSFLGGLQRQARVTQDFKGTLDYIWFFTRGCLQISYCEKVR